jgi:leucyl-tRNA synthetase
MTYAVLAPDHPKVSDFIGENERVQCEAYIREAKNKSDQDRTNEGREKTGVFTGSYVLNPYNGESVPLWIADYVLGSYGTGAVMAVPAHDERDWEFAKKYNLPIRQSIRKHWIFQDDKKARPGVETLKRRVIDVIFENDK